MTDQEHLIRCTGNYRGKGIHDQCRACHRRLAYLEDVRWPMRLLAAFVELPIFKGDKCPARIPPNPEMPE